MKEIGFGFRQAFNLSKLVAQLVCQHTLHHTLLFIAFLSSNCSQTYQ